MTNEQAIKWFKEHNGSISFEDTETLVVGVYGVYTTVVIDDLTAHNFLTQYVTPAIEALSGGTT